MAQTQDVTALERRLYHLEMKLYGVQLARQKKESDEAATTTNNKNNNKSKSTARNLGVTFSAELDNESTTAGAGAGADDRMTVLDTTPQTKTTDQDDFATRLSALEQQVASTRSSSQRVALEGHWREIHQYLQDLDPGSALTHQSSIANPFMYRRQEVLASAEELKRNMQYVTDILNLLLIGQNLPSSTSASSSSVGPMTSSSSGGGKSASSASSAAAAAASSSSSSSLTLISEMHVTKAPILMTAPALSREKQEELNTLEETLHLLRDRVDRSASKLDCLITGYQKVVTTISEKLVLLDEELRTKQQQHQQ